jgi:Subtilase family/Dockerin type I domain
MSIKTTLGAAVLAAAVIGTTGMAVYMTDREAALIRHFPALASTTRHVGSFVVDPLLRPGSEGKAVEQRYDAAMKALIAAQRRLAHAEEGHRKLAEKLGYIDTERLRKDVKTAEANAIAARPTAWSAPRVEERTLLVLFRETATPKQIAHVLEKHRLSVLSGNASISMFVVEVLDERPPGMREAEASLLWARIAELEKEPKVETAVVNVLLSATVVPGPNNPASGRDWMDDDDPLVLSRFPAAWNFMKAIEARKDIVDVGVLDEGFADANADDLPMKFPGPCLVTGNVHGTQVAGIIGAAWGNGTGVDGAAPRANLFGCAPASAGFDKFDMTLETLLHEAPTVRVVNASVGYNWPKITPTVQTVVAGHGAAIRRTMKMHPKVVLVSSAGNDCLGITGCADPATWTSPFNWAALGPEEGNPPSRNIIVVQALNAKATARLPLSNVSNMIGAIGVGLLTVTDTHSFGKMAASTSAATPLVTAAVALMLGVNPNLTMTQIKDNLGIPNARLNAFRAVFKSSNTAERDLADRNGDQKVDMTDFEEFRKSFRLSPADAKRDHCDFDGDGHVNREDLKVMMRVWTDTNIDPNTLPGKL